MSVQHDEDALAIMGPICVKPAGKKGRGVFATAPIKAGELIERCPVIALEQGMREFIDQTPLYYYYYAWNDDYEGAAFMLGYGSIYNHSFKPNANFEQIFSKGYMNYIAIKDIKAGDEITVNYNGEPDDQEPLPYLTVENED